MSLDIWNRVHVRVGESFSLRVRGEGTDILSEGTDNLVYLSMARLFDEAGVTPPGLHISCTNTIPLGRGLGSSAAAVVGGLVAANALCGNLISHDRLLELATEIENHPDNVGPALLGGCRAMVQDGRHIVAARVPVPRRLRAVVYIPDQSMSTQASRARLDNVISREDAVFNIGRTALLINSLNQNDLDYLALATQDRLHQPARARIFPAMHHLIKAGLDGGARAVFLSGGGSSVLALTTGNEMTVGFEMADAAEKWGVSGKFIVTRPTPRGAHVTKSS
jgi:homoserine kinase